MNTKSEPATTEMKSKVNVKAMRPFFVHNDVTPKRPASSQYLRDMGNRYRGFTIKVTPTDELTDEGHRQVVVQHTFCSLHEPGFDKRKGREAAEAAPSTTINVVDLPKYAAECSNTLFVYSYLSPYSIKQFDYLLRNFV